MFEFVTTEAIKRGIISDIIVGSGWPIGGEFLRKEETIQKVLSHKIKVGGGRRVFDETYRGVTEIYLMISSWASTGMACLSFR